MLVKVKKPQQERRVDLPTIGVETVERIAQMGFAGVAVEAGASLILNRREVARRANWAYLSSAFPSSNNMARIALIAGEASASLGGWLMDALIAKRWTQHSAALAGQ